MKSDFIATGSRRASRETVRKPSTTLSQQNLPKASTKALPPKMLARNTAPTADEEKRPIDNVIASEKAAPDGIREVSSVDAAQANAATRQPLQSGNSPPAGSSAKVVDGAQTNGGPSQPLGQGEAEAINNGQKASIKIAVVDQQTHTAAIQQQHEEGQPVYNLDEGSCTTASDDSQSRAAAIDSDEKGERVTLLNKSTHQVSSVGDDLQAHLATAAQPLELGKPVLDLQPAGEQEEQPGEPIFNRELIGEDVEPSFTHSTNVDDAPEKPVCVGEDPASQVNARQTLIEGLQEMPRYQLIGMYERMQITAEKLEASYAEELEEEKALEADEAELTETLETLLVSAQHLKITGKSTHSYDSDWESSIQDAKSAALPYVRAWGSFIIGHRGALQVNDHLGDLAREPSVSPKSLERFRKHGLHSSTGLSPPSDQAQNPPPASGFLDRLAERVGSVVTAAVEGATETKKRMTESAAAARQKMGNESNLSYNKDPALGLGRTSAGSQRFAEATRTELGPQGDKNSAHTLPETQSMKVGNAEDQVIAEASPSPATPFIIEAKVDMTGHTTGGGSHVLHVRATEDCSEAAERFAKSHALSSADCQALAGYLIAVEERTEKFPVYECVRLMDIPRV